MQINGGKLTGLVVALLYVYIFEPCLYDSIIHLP